MKVNEHRQTLLANNIANANTTGFKHDLAVVSQRSVASKGRPDGMTASHPVLDGMTGGINVKPTFISFEQGRIERTDRPLDVAIDGEGFLTVSDGEATRYTRDGEFATTNSGHLILAAGEGRWRVLDEDGAPVILDPELAAASIGGDGTIRQGKVIVAKLALVGTSEKQNLRKVGGNLFELTRGQMEPTTGQLASGAREDSTFDAISGLAGMIEAARAYQMNSTMIQLQDQATGLAAGTLGRVA
jgi:flagellar basal body rod protein FlgG